MTSKPPGPLGWWAAGMDWLAGVAFYVLLNLLVVTYFSVFPMRIVSVGEYEPSPPPEPADIAKYWIIASAMLILLLFGFVVAVSQWRKPAMIVYPLVGAFAVATILMFSLPKIDWGSSNSPYDQYPGGCRLTHSEDCPGG